MVFKLAEVDLKLRGPGDIFWNKAKRFTGFSFLSISLMTLILLRMLRV